MVLWQCDVRISWRAQWLSLLLHGVIATVLLLLPWPLSLMPVWLLLVSLVVFGCIRSQRRIRARHGLLALLEGDRLTWQGREWRLNGPPWLLPGGMLLNLSGDDAHQRLWLAADSLDARAWRELRRLLLGRD